VRLLSSLGPCSHACNNVLIAIRALARRPSGRRARRAPGGVAAAGGASAAAVPAAARRAGGAATAADVAAAGNGRRAEAQRAGVIQEGARNALQALTSPPGARLRESFCVEVVSTLMAAPPKCAACGAAAPPGGGPLQKCSGCGGPERWCSKECQRLSWKAGHRDVCKERQAGGGGS
jgi:hypothetical protein